MQTNTKRSLGFLAVGVAAGAVTALLLAPKSGRETRSDLRRQADRLNHRRRGVWQKFRSRRSRHATAPTIWEVDGVLTNGAAAGPYPHS